MITDLSDLSKQFKDLDLRNRHDVLDALIASFRPSDYRHLASKLFPERFVGDFVSLLPAEVSDMIFSYLEPQELFRFKNVSSVWNAYLARPGFLQAMDILMYHNSGGFALDPESEFNKKASFYEKVRNRCALLRGEACSFNVFKHPAGTISQLAYSHGVLVNYADSRIWVKRLLQEAEAWESLVGDDLEAFDVVQVTARFIIAITRMSVVYCWDAHSLNRLAKFRLPELPFEAEASRDCIVLFCNDSWYLYDMDKHRLSRHPTPQGPDLEYTMGHVEPDGHVYTVRVDGTITTFKIDETKTKVVRLSSQNVNDILRQSEAAEDAETEDVAFLTDADQQAIGISNTNYRPPPNIVVVWNHGSLYSSPITIKGAPTKIYTLSQGQLHLSHTFQHDALKPSELTFFPTLHRAFDLICQHDRGMPLGMYQIHNDSWRPVTPGNFNPDREQQMYTTTTSAWTIPLGGRQQASANRGDLDWAVRYEDEACLWTGDAQMLICSHITHGFTRMWKFV